MLRRSTRSQKQATLPRSQAAPSSGGRITHSRPNIAAIVSNNTQRSNLSPRRSTQSMPADSHDTPSPVRESSPISPAEVSGNSESEGENENSNSDLSSVPTDSNHSEHTDTDDSEHNDSDCSGDTDSDNSGCTNSDDSEYEESTRGRTRAQKLSDQPSPPPSLENSSFSHASSSNHDVITSNHQSRPAVPAVPSTSNKKAEPKKAQPGKRIMSQNVTQAASTKTATLKKFDAVTSGVLKPIYTQRVTRSQAALRSPSPEDLPEPKEDRGYSKAILPGGGKYTEAYCRYSVLNEVKQFGLNRGLPKDPVEASDSGESESDNEGSESENEGSESDGEGAESGSEKTNFNGQDSGPDGQEDGPDGQEDGPDGEDQEEEDVDEGYEPDQEERRNRHIQLRNNDIHEDEDAPWAGYVNGVLIRIPSVESVYERLWPDVPLEMLTVDDKLNDSYQAKYRAARLERSVRQKDRPLVLQELSYHQNGLPNNTNDLSVFYFTNENNNDSKPEPSFFDEATYHLEDMHNSGEQSQQEQEYVGSGIAEPENGDAIDLLFGDEIEKEVEEMAQVPLPFVIQDFGVLDMDTEFVQAGGSGGVPSPSATDAQVSASHTFMAEGPSVVVADEKVGEVSVVDDTYSGDDNIGFCEAFVLPNSAPAPIDEALQSHVSQCDRDIAAWNEALNNGTISIADFDWSGLYTEEPTDAQLIGAQVELDAQLHSGSETWENFDFSEEIEDVQPALDEPEQEVVETVSTPELVLVVSTPTPEAAPVQRTPWPVNTPIPDQISYFENLLAPIMASNASARTSVVPESKIPIAQAPVAQAHSQVIDVDSLPTPGPIDVGAPTTTPAPGRANNYMPYNTDTGKFQDPTKPPLPPGTKRKRPSMPAGYFSYAAMAARKARRVAGGNGSVEQPPTELQTPINVAPTTPTPEISDGTPVNAEFVLPGVTGINNCSRKVGPAKKPRAKKPRGWYTKEAKDKRAADREARNIAKVPGRGMRPSSNVANPLGPTPQAHPGDIEGFVRSGRNSRIQLPADSLAYIDGPPMVVDIDTNDPTYFTHGRLLANTSNVHTLPEHLQAEFWKEYQHKSTFYFFNCGNLEQGIPSTTIRIESPWGVELPPPECEECGETFPREWNKVTHFKVAHPKLRGRCHHCPDKPAFGRLASLRRHIETFHPWTCSHRCPACGKSSETGKRLDTHQKLCKAYREMHPEEFVGAGPIPELANRRGRRPSTKGKQTAEVTKAALQRPAHTGGKDPSLYAAVQSEDELDAEDSELESDSEAQDGGPISGYEPNTDEAVEFIQIPGNDERINTTNTARANAATVNRNEVPIVISDHVLLPHAGVITATRFAEGFQSIDGDDDDLYTVDIGPAAALNTVTTAEHMGTSTTTTAEANITQATEINEVSAVPYIETIAPHPRHARERAATSDAGSPSGLDSREAVSNPTTATTSLSGSHSLAEIKARQCKARKARGTRAPTTTQQENDMLESATMGVSPISTFNSPESSCVAPSRVEKRQPKQRPSKK